MEFSALAGNDRLKEQLSQQESGRGLALWKMLPMQKDNRWNPSRF